MPLVVPSSDHPPSLHSFPTRRSSDLFVSLSSSSRVMVPEILLPPVPEILLLQSEGSEQDDSRIDLGHHGRADVDARVDRKSTRLNSSHLVISYAVFCLKKKTTNNRIC